MPTSPYLPAPRKNAFSHERILELCRAYKRLREHVRTVQAQIDDAIDTFQHSTHSQQSLSQMITTLATIDGNIGAALQNDILTIELELVNWETRSAKLRSESRRQARRRAERNDRGASAIGQPYLTGSNATDDVFGDFGDNPTDPSDSSPEPSTPIPPPDAPMSPTMVLALRGMQQLHEVDRANATSRNTADAAEKFVRDHAAGVASELKKSGLV